MDINPQVVRTSEFKTVKRGFDPSEVGSFLSRVADELERAQNHATAMEARARAAVQRIQELTEHPLPAPSPESTPQPSAEEAETISRTLLLAQRTADTTLRDARDEAERLVAEASEQATGLLDAAREERTQLIETARHDARQEGEAERAAVRQEVETMRSRREALRADVDHLEQFLVAQRERVRDAGTTLLDLTERIPGGLGHAAAPLLTSLEDEHATGEDDTAPLERVTPDGAEASPEGDATALAAGDPADPADPADPGAAGEPPDPGDEVTWATGDGADETGERGEIDTGELAVVSGRAVDEPVGAEDPTPVGRDTTGSDGPSTGAGDLRLDLRDER